MSAPRLADPNEEPPPESTLRRIAREVDRRAKRQESLPHIWQGLLAGKWMPVDAFETETRHYLVARRTDPDEADRRALSERERAVVELAAQGLTDRRIAERLGIALSTAATQRARALDKLGIRSRTLLAQLAQRD